MNRVYFSKNWHWITIIGIAVISFLVCLGWKLGIAISFAVLSIFVSAFFAVRSLKLTQDSLELTRATTRPFLNVLGIDVGWFGNEENPTTPKHFHIDISNTGTFPADQVSIVLNVSKTDSDNQKHSFVVEGEIPSICFPGGEISLMFTEAGCKQKLTVNYEEKLEVQIEITYRNKLTREIHKTIRSYSVQHLQTVTKKITQLRKDDYWS